MMAILGIIIISGCDLWDGGWQDVGFALYDAVNVGVVGVDLGE